MSHISTVVNRFWKWSLNDRFWKWSLNDRFWKWSLNDPFLFRFTIVSFLEKRSFLKKTHSFWTFKKRITIVLENDRFLKNDLWPFLYNYFFKTIAFEKTTFFEKKILLKIMLTIVNEGLSLTIVNETIILKTNSFKKRSFLKMIVSFSIFRSRYHNETIVFLKNENVNIPVKICIIALIVR